MRLHQGEIKGGLISSEVLIVYQVIYETYPFSKSFLGVVCVLLLHLFLYIQVRRPQESKSTAIVKVNYIKSTIESQHQQKFKSTIESQSQLQKVYINRSQSHHKVKVKVKVKSAN